MEGSELLHSMETHLSRLDYQLAFSSTSNLPTPQPQNTPLVTQLSANLFVLQARNQIVWVNRAERKVFVLDSKRLKWNLGEKYSRLNMGRFLNQLCALILSLDGYTVFHGNVLLLPNKTTVAILGESGKGKSTLSFALSRMGAQLISDDLCAFDLHTMEIKFKCSTLSLAPSAFQQFEQKWQTEEQKSKLTLPIQDSCDLKHLPKLTQAYKLAPHNTAELALRKLKPAETIFEYLKCSIIDPRELGISIESYLESRLQFCKQLPLSLFHIPRNFNYLSAACEKILAADS